MVILATMGMLQQLFTGRPRWVILQLAAPDGFSWRIMGVQTVIFHSASPLCVFAIGALGTLIGISTAFVAAGVIVLMVALLAVVRLDVIRGLRTSRLLSGAKLDLRDTAADPAS